MDSNNINAYKCPVEYSLSIIGGKWKTVILWHLASEGIKRYGEIKKSLNGITHKTLSSQLKELESDGLINRKEYQQIPPKVEYSLTEKGKTLIPVLNSLCAWGSNHMPK
jgi:DNA-binding HxlR family transcriptional regulator